VYVEDEYTTKQLPNTELHAPTMKYIEFDFLVKSALETRDLHAY